MQERRSDAFAIVTRTLATLLQQLPADASAQISPNSALVFVLSPTPAGNEADSPLHVAALLAPSKPCDLQNAGQAYVVGPPRPLAAIKDTNWVVSRKPIAAQVPQHAVEGLLQTDEGCLLEGLVTNLFVIRDVGAGNVQLQTAPVDTVLEGISRVRVLQAARELGYDVEETPPAWRDRDTWREAFLCNCLRMLQPVARIECRAENAPPGVDAWHADLTKTCGDHTAQLRAHALQLMEATPLDALSAALQSCGESEALTSAGAL